MSDCDRSCPGRSDMMNVIFFAANAGLTEDFGKFDEEQHTFFIITQLLSKVIEEQVAERGRPILGAKLEGWDTKSFIFSLFTI